MNPERPLSEYGRQQSESLGRFMAANGVRVNAVWHSSLLRAKQTATQIALAIDAQELLEQRDDLSPMDSINSVESSIRDYNQNLMIVGHLPFMGNLFSHLLTGEKNASLAQFSTACAASLIYSRGACSLVWFVGPEQLG